MTGPAAVQSGLADQLTTIARVVLRDEHHARTSLAWLETLERRWSEIVGLVGEPRRPGRRPYLVGAALTFEEHRMGVDQILAARPAVDGFTEVPDTRVAWETTGA